MRIEEDFFFLNKNLMKPKDASKAANVNYNTARKWKQAYNNDP